MTALVASLRRIGRDLIEKRLWPVAVLLLVALVAAPMMIGGSADEAPAPALAAAAAEPDTAATASTDADPSTATTAPRAKPSRGGQIDDPFFDPPSPKAEGAGSASAPAGSTRAEAASPTGEAAPRAGTTSAKGPPATPTPTTTTTTTKRPATTPAAPGRPTTAPGRTAPVRTYLRTAVRVNGNGGAWPRPMARLEPVGGARRPAALFLGVTTAGARYAVFALAANATSRGEGTCKGGTDCRMIGLKAGQTHVVTVHRSDGSKRRYSLAVRSIRAVWTTAARARAARARVHDDGVRVLRAMRRHHATAAALRTARYEARTGLLRAAVARPAKHVSE